MELAVPPRRRRRASSADSPTSTPATPPSARRLDELRRVCLEGGNVFEA